MKHIIEKADKEIKEIKEKEINYNFVGIQESSLSFKKRKRLMIKKEELKRNKNV